MKKNKFIYLVRCYYLNLDSKNNRTVRERTWGYYYSLQKARKCILENWTDIFESDYYNFAVIMKMPEGVCVTPGSTLEWYRNDYSRKSRKHNIVKIDFDPINLNRQDNSNFKYFISW